MPKYSLYSVRDEAAAVFTDPQIAPFDEVAIRNFDYAALKNDIMNFRPEDFSLWIVGHFDSDNGVITPLGPMKIKHGMRKENTDV